MELALYEFVLNKEPTSLSESVCSRGPAPFAPEPELRVLVELLTIAAPGSPELAVLTEKAFDEELDIILKFRR